MRGSSLVTTLVLAGALTCGAQPAFAQRGGGHGGGGGGHMGGGGGHMGGGGGARMGGGGHFGGGHFGGMPPAIGVPRGSAGVRGGGFDRGGWFNGHRGAFEPRFNTGSHWWGGRYYAFHPHFSLGFGLWAGYPLTWAYPYYYPPYPYYPNYPYYPYPNPYTGPGYSVGPSVDVAQNTQPDQSNLGGMSFEITPSDAQVFIDGNYAGPVGQFTSSTQPLGVTAGRHHVEVRSTGYKTMSFDVDIVAGQVIPYQGRMER